MAGASRAAPPELQANSGIGYDRCQQAAEIEYFNLKAK